MLLLDVIGRLSQTKMNVQGCIMCGSLSDEVIGALLQSQPRHVFNEHQHHCSKGTTYLASCSIARQSRPQRRKLHTKPALLRAPRFPNQPQSLAEVLQVAHLGQEPPQLCQVSAVDLLLFTTSLAQSEGNFNNVAEASLPRIQVEP